MVLAQGSPYGESENRVWNQEREKGFSLGRNARGWREQGIAAFKKIAKKEIIKGYCLQGDSQGGERKVLLRLKEIISVCVRE